MNYRTNLGLGALSKHSRQWTKQRPVDSFTVMWASESICLLHPAHRKHFLCHRVALGPGWVSKNGMLSLHRAHVRTPPSLGKLFFLDLNISDGLVMPFVFLMTSLLRVTFRSFVNDSFFFFCVKLRLRAQPSQYILPWYLESWRLIGTVFWQPAHKRH